MHHFRILLITILCSGIFGSCNYLDYQPDDILTLEKVFDNRVQTEDWLAGIYNGIPSPYWDNIRHLGYDSMSDDVAPSTGWEQFGWSVIGQQTGNWNPSRDQSAGIWSNFPKLIRSAFIFIEEAHPIPKDNLTQEQVDRMKLEARFLIAYYYSFMTNIYGPIPLIKKKLPLDAEPSLFYAKRNTLEETVEWVNNELKALSNLLPDEYPEVSRNYGRPTKYAAMAVRARMLMFYASPLVNGNPDNATFIDKDGVQLISSQYQHERWREAAEACEELINCGKFDLYKEYIAGKIDPFMSLRNLWTTRADQNPEIIFAKPQNNTWELSRHANPRRCGNGGLGITQSLVDAFFMKNGLPITDSKSGYVEKGFSEQDYNMEDTKYNDGKYMGNITLAGTYNMYNNREPRFYLAIAFDRMWHKVLQDQLRFRLSEPDNPGNHDAPQNGYLLRKRVHPEHKDYQGQSNNPYRPEILYRLGEVYLNYAEALNEYNFEQNKDQILKYVNLIRERAGIPIYGSDNIPVPNTQEEMRDAIRKERRVELCAEGIRYDDIRRWMIGEQVLNKEFMGMNARGTDAASFYQRVPYQKRVYSKKCYWWPVPQNEIDKNANLIQNPGWE